MKTITRIFLVGIIASAVCLLAIWGTGGCPPYGGKNEGTDIGGGIVVRRTPFGDIYVNHK